jgi:hypothetical protein
MTSKALSNSGRSILGRAEVDNVGTGFLSRKD